MSHLYFAYGSNMDETQMAQRCPGAKLIGTATLPNYRFIISPRGYATIRSEKGMDTPGLLWQINASHEATLDQYEGHPAGLYDKCVRTLCDNDGKSQKALVYIDHDASPLAIARSGYLERVIRAAEAHDLPCAHITMLQAWPRHWVFQAFDKLMNWLRSERPVSEMPPALLAMNGICVPSNIPIDEHYRREIILQLKSKQDGLILETLDELRDNHLEDWGEPVDDTFAAFPSPSENPCRWFEKRFLEKVMETFESLAKKYNRKKASEQALAYYELARFQNYLEFLQKDDNVHVALSEWADEREIAGAGIIITADPSREHDSSDRFIVTPRAPLLAALWHAVFLSAHSAHPRSCRYMDVFADVAESGIGDEIIAHTLGLLSDVTQEGMCHLSHSLDQFQL